MKLAIQKSILPVLTLCTLLGGASSGQAQPTVNAPTPTRPSASVLSMFNSSGTYTDHGGIGWYAPWSGVTSMGDYTISGGNTVKSYLGLSYSGVEFYNPNQIDATAYNTLHVDVWTTANQIALKVVSTDNNSAPEIFFPASSGVVTSNQWVGLDIPISALLDINPNFDVANIDQMLFVDNGDLAGPGVQLGDFYIDNVYFYSNSVVGPTIVNYPTVPAPTPTQPATNVLAMFNSSGVYPNSPPNDWLATWSGANYFPYTITNTTQTVLKYTALNYAGVEFYDPSQIDASGYNTVHVDVWTPNANQFGMQLVSLNPTVGPQVDFLPASGKIITNNWVSLDIPLSQFSAAAAAGGNTLILSDLQQLLWIDNQNGGGVTAGTFYIDNVYFYNAAVVAVSPAITATASGGNISVAFASQNNFSYTLQSKTNLTDATWQDVSTVSGNGSPMSIPDVTNHGHRFYRVYVH